MCLIYIRQYSACGPFWPTACCFVSLILCWFSVPFFTPLAYVWMISTFWLLPCHTSFANIGCQQKTLGKKKCEVQKAPFSSKAYASLSFGRCEVYLQVMAPIRPEPRKWSQQYPRYQSVIHRWWLQTVLLMTTTKCVKILTRTLRTFVKLLPHKISDIMKNHTVLEKSFLQQQEDTINQQSSTCSQYHQPWSTANLL